MKFSIITITYNAASVLEQTIISILTQSYGNIEYIIVDGKSTDETVNIIKQYSDGVANWISEPDSGLYDAMNKGIDMATGDYIWFINAGDKLHSADVVSQLAKQISAYQPNRNVKPGEMLPDVIYGQTEIIDSKGNSLGLRRLKAPNSLTWRSFIWGMTVCHQSFIIKRNIAPKYDLGYRFSSDVDWCIRGMKQARRLYNSRLILSNFLEGGMSDINRKTSLKERYQIMCVHYGKPLTIVMHLWFAVRHLISKKQ